MPTSQVLFQQQVVSSGDVVVFVGFDAPGRIFQIELELAQFGQDALVDGHAMIPDHYPTVEGDIRYLLAPRMGVNFLKRKPFGGIHVQDLLQQIFEMVGNEIGQHILARKDLFVKLGSVVVLEGEVATDHGEEDDAAAPDVDFEPVILFAGDHFGGGVAGGPAGSLEHLVLLVGVAEPEIHYF